MTDEVKTEIKISDDVRFESYLERFNLCGEEASIWLQETLRHLSLFAFAGIAGIITLKAGNNPRISADELDLGIYCFGASSVICISSMILQFMTARNERENHRQRLRQLTNMQVIGISGQDGWGPKFSYWVSIVFVGLSLAGILVGSYDVLRVLKL